LSLMLYYKWPIVTMRLSGTVTKIWRLKDNEVTSLIFGCHVTSSVTERKIKKEKRKKGKGKERERESGGGKREKGRRKGKKGKRKGKGKKKEKEKGEG